MLEADDRLRSALVTVHTPTGQVAGGGVYVRPGPPGTAPVLLTCAHVVSLALGRDGLTELPPQGAHVGLSFPALPGMRAAARVTRWWPPQPAGDVPGRWTGDVAVLDAAEALPEGLRAVPLAVPELGDRLWAWRGNGDPRTVVPLRVNGTAGEWLVLQAPPTGFAVQPGYSGGPLWDRRRQAVVGLVVSAHEHTAFSATTTATPARQCYAVRGDVLLRRLADGQAAGEMLDPRLVTLLAAQRQAARTFPYRSVGLHRDDLTQVYVRQQVAGAEPAPVEARLPEPGAEDGGGQDHRPPTTVEEFLVHHRHVLVTGPPGSGKSTLSLQLSAAPVVLPGAPGGDRPSVLVPVRVAARDLAARPEVDLTAGVSALARRTALARTQADIGAGLCVPPYPAAGTAWLVIVDGLDEVSDPHERAELTDRLHAFLDTGSGHQVLVTTRPLPPRERERWQSRTDLLHCAVEPFEREQRRQFAHRWFRDAHLADSFIARIAAARLADLVSVPLLATVAAVVFEEAAGQALPSTAFGMYQRFVAHLYESRTAPATFDLRGRLAAVAGGEQLAERLATGRIDLLEHVATAWLEGADLLPAALKRLRATGTQPYPLPTDWAETVTAVLTSTGLVAHDGAGLGFVHRSFAEHLAAAAEARKLPARFDPDAPPWWDALRHAMEGSPTDRDALVHRALLADADGLLDWLLAGNHKARELGARLVFEGVPSRPAHHTALAESFAYWAYSGHAVNGVQPRRHEAVLVRALDTVRLAPAPVLDVLETLLDPDRFTLQVRDAAIRALLRNGERAATATAALTAVVGERGLTGAQRVRAAEMLMDLGGEHRAAARAGLDRMTEERHWVPAEQRERAARLVREIDAAAAEGAAAGGTSAEERAGERSLLFDLAAPPRAPGPAGRDEPATSEPPAPPRARRRRRRVPSWDEILFGTAPLYTADDEAADLDEEPEEAADLDEAPRPTGLPYPLGAELGLPPDASPAATGTVVRAALRAASAPSSHAAAQARRDAAAPTGGARPAPGNPHGPQGPGLTRDEWEALGRWLSAQPGLAVLTAADLPDDPVGIVAQSGRPLAVAVAGALMHGGGPSTRLACAVLARVVHLSFTDPAPLLDVFTGAMRAAPAPFGAWAVEPMLDALYSGLNAARWTSSFRAARQVESDLVAYILSADRQPDTAVRALLRIGEDHAADGLEVLAAQLPGFPYGTGPWCAALRVLVRQPGCAPAAVELLRDAADAVTAPEDVLTVAETLVPHAPDTAAEHLARLAQDATAPPHVRREAARLLAGLPGSRPTAHRVLAELVAADPPAADRLHLARVLCGIDPQGVAKAADLGFGLLRQTQLHATLREETLALLADLGPQVRRRVLGGLADTHAEAAEAAAVRMARLERLSAWGPDFHRAVTAVWERQVRAATGPARVPLAADLYGLGWLSADRASRLLSAMARDPGGDPLVRLNAARALLSHQPDRRQVAGRTVEDLLTSRAIPPQAALQVARDLAAAGNLTTARAVLQHLCTDQDLPGPVRYKAATLLLMTDRECGPQTRAVLARLAADQSLDPPTRAWASFALDFTADGIQPPGALRPPSWPAS
ncbi:NACHT domain-containing protein [Actinacidiphila bryophytorum]|uniref:NACHT domain-containing protein n=1 Tax=Actinacidiphila bryophytorum TaxID=1436133 RepID=A0A9W4MI25_9ACTN|nr:NACHT domain-containing protein [Actinacidiphila bryophytorum]